MACATTLGTLLHWASLLSKPCLDLTEVQAARRPGWHGQVPVAPAARCQQMQMTDSSGVVWQCDAYWVGSTSALTRVLTTSSRCSSFLVPSVRAYCSSTTAMMTFSTTKLLSTKQRPKKMAAACTPSPDDGQRPVSVALQPGVGGTWSGLPPSSLPAALPGTAPAAGCVLASWVHMPAVTSMKEQDRADNCTFVCTARGIDLNHHQAYRSGLVGGHTHETRIACQVTLSHVSPDVTWKMVIQALGNVLKFCLGIPSGKLSWRPNSIMAMTANTVTSKKKKANRLAMGTALAQALPKTVRLPCRSRMSNPAHLQHQSDDIILEAVVIGQSAYFVIGQSTYLVSAVPFSSVIRQLGRATPLCFSFWRR